MFFSSALLNAIFFARKAELPGCVTNGQAQEETSPRCCAAILLFCYISLPPGFWQGEGITIDRSGGFVYVANDGSNGISAFSVTASSGALTPIAGSRFATGQNPYGIASCRRIRGVCKPGP